MTLPWIMAARRLTFGIVYFWADRFHCLKESG